VVPLDVAGVVVLVGVVLVGVVLAGVVLAGRAGVVPLVAGAATAAGAAVPLVVGAVAKKLNESSSRRSGSFSYCERISSSSQALGPGSRAESPGAAESVIPPLYDLKCAVAG